MKSTHKLLAAITASGAVLTLGVSVQAHQAGDPSVSMHAGDTKPLAERVERLRTKLLASSPVFQEGSPEGRIDNVVQFFNFRNK